METTKLFALENAENIFGKIKPAIKDRIVNYISNPTVDNWDDIHCILITPSKTIWQAVIAIDNSFPHYGRSEDRSGKIIKEWERIPEVNLVKSAITNIVLKLDNHLN